MIDLRSLFYGIAGAARLIRLDISGAHMMVKGLRGFWASLYWSAGLVAPLYLLLMALRFNSEQHEPLRYTVVHVELYIISWLIFPIFMERISGLLRRRDKYLDFIIPYVWLGCLYNTFYMLVGLAQASNMISWEAASSIAVGLMFAGLVWIGHLAKKTLDIPYSAAIGIVIIDLFLSIMMSIIKAGLLAGT